MELSNEFRVGVPVQRAYDVLTDLERIAPCMPGAQLQEVEGDEFRGLVKVKVGPITANYQGAATFVEREAPSRIVLQAEGRETRNQGNASATIRVDLAPDGDGTHVSVVTDLNVTGKVAQFGGRGVLADVSAKLLGQFVQCLESTVLAGDGTAGEAEGDVDDEVAEPEPPDGEAAEPAPTPEAVPAVRKVDAPEPQPVDLLATAGTPVAKRVGPVLAGAALLWLLGLFLRRRRRR
jgi:carbon monoxide dehydrogenase subunit G